MWRTLCLNSSFFFSILSLSFSLSLSLFLSFSLCTLVSLSVSLARHTHIIRWWEEERVPELDKCSWDSLLSLSLPIHTDPILGWIQERERENSLLPSLFTLPLSLFRITQVFLYQDYEQRGKKSPGESWREREGKKFRKRRERESWRIQEKRSAFVALLLHPREKWYTFS